MLKIMLAQSTKAYYRNAGNRQRKNPRFPHENIDKFCQSPVCYAPNFTSSLEAKDQFYVGVEESVFQIPRFESLYLLGEFNASVGSDWQAWPACLGHCGVGKLNENGQRLLELCCHRSLCITNSYFKCKELHKVFWRHPGPASGTSLISSSKVCFTGAATSAQTMTRIIPSLAARSG